MQAEVQRNICQLLADGGQMTDDFIASWVQVLVVLQLAQAGYI